ncbi:MAG: HAMP domain-containing protein [Candidatus Riflebacteria bacterium]|nr:HAMP domain-containing protein [Candidatus Riflebacteria bacterium]
MSRESTPRFLAGWLFRLFFIGLIIWRSICRLPFVANQFLFPLDRLSSASHALLLGTVGTLVFDVVAFLALLFGTGRRSVRALLAIWFLAYVPVSLRIGVNLDYLWYNGVGVLLGLSMAMVGCAVFREMAIRGRIFLVCLFAAIVPMIILGFSITRQFDFMLDAAYVPWLQRLVKIPVKELDRSLGEKLRTGLRLVYGCDPAGRGFRFPKTIAEFSERVHEADIPMPIIKEVFLPETIESIPLHLDGEPLRSALVKAFGGKLPVNVVSSDPALLEQRVTLDAKNWEIGRTIRGIASAATVALDWDGRTVTVRRPEDPISASPATLLPLPVTPSEFDTFFNEAALFCDRMSTDTVFVTWNKCDAKGTEVLDLVIPWNPRFPGRSFLFAQMDLAGWLMKRIPSTETAENPGLRFIYPNRLEDFQRVFPGFRIPDRVKESQAMFHVSNTSLTEKSMLQNFPVLGTADPEAHYSRYLTLKSGIDKDKFAGEVLLDPKFYDRDEMLVDGSGTPWVLAGWNTDVSKIPFLTTFSFDRSRRILLSQFFEPVWYGLIALFIAGALSILSSSSLSRPIREITVAALRIRDGDLATEIPESSDGGEIHDLALALRFMAEGLKGRLNLANRQLLREKDKLETLLESTREGILMITGEGQIAYANVAARAWFELPQLTPSTPDKPRETPDTSPEPMPDFLEALRKIGTKFQPPPPGSWKPDLEAWHTMFETAPTGSLIPKVLVLYVKRLPDPGGDTEIGEHSRFLAVFRDVTVEREIDRMKSEFVSLVSHELRTPLTSIKAYTEMILDGDVSDEMQKREYLQIVDDETDRLTRLINELLDIARIESGRRPLRREQIDLVAITGEVLNLIGTQAAAKGLKIILAPGPAKALFVGDPDLLKQLAINLTSNAVKYTKEGEVTISLEVGTNGETIWRFADTGIGLTPDEQEKLFTRFFRADSDYVRSTRGTGLGLALVKQIADAHGAQITIDSTWGKGSIFSVHLRSEGHQAPPPA